MATVLNPPSVDVHSSSHPDTSPHPMDSAPSPPVYGLSYSPDFIASLPTLLSDPRIRAITAAQYSHIYSQYSNADVPDSVLFPFLHGLEGDNQAQNQFFLASQPAPVPRYRGLVSVVCTEDPGDSIELPSGSSSATQDSCSEGCASDGSASDSDSSDSEEDEVLVDELMDEDIATVTENNNDGEITMRIPPSDDPVLVLDKDKLQTLTTAPTQHDLPPPSAPSHSSSMLTIDTSSTSSSSTLESDTAETSLYTPTPELRKPSHLLNSTFYPHELLDISATDGPVFLKPRIPEGISLRNFSIQAPTYATLCDIFLYSPSGLPSRPPSPSSPTTSPLLSLASSFSNAISRLSHMRHSDIPYTVFVIADPFEVFEKDYPHLVGVDAKANSINKLDFMAREKDEMAILTKASEVAENVWLGNTVDVPLPPAHTTRPGPFDPTLNPEGYDLCIECRDDGCFPTLAELRQAQDHISALEQAWQSRYPQTSFNQHRRTLSSPPAAPSSPSPLTNGLSSFSFGSPPPTPSSRGASPPPSASTSTSSFKKYMSWENVESPLQQESKPRPAPHPASIIHLSFPSSPPSIADTTTQTLPLLTFLSKVTTSAAQESTRWSRPLKVLLHSPEGYTDTSVLALAYTMYTLPATLPQAYLHLQNDRNRSFFVHETDLRVLKRLEANLGCRDRAAMLGIESLKNGGSKYPTSRWSAWSRGSVDSPYCPWTKAPSVVPWDRPAQQQMQRKEQRRARSSTAPILYHAPSSDERDQHQAWFDDPRFDGSFPSRVLPFLYLGNLNHASNVHMLHALGITHVVSVGECALVAPGAPPSPASFDYGRKGKTGKECGSLWTEEREGRIKVLDIKGVCDDGIDSLRSQLGPIVSWIDEGRASGGKVLVHCRVGVSRSASVVIAYVMKHLDISLVDAYLMVRSRRLSVLIQPNMRLLYNLLGYEAELAREKGKEVDYRSRLSWPFLAREVHALNLRYLQ